MATCPRVETGAVTPRGNLEHSRAPLKDPLFLHPFRAGKARKPTAMVRSAWEFLDRRPLEVVLFINPGHDPGDVEALLVAVALHRQGRLCLRGVICSGSRALTARARLALCILDHLGVLDVPVGAGSSVEPGSHPLPYEFRLAGYSACDPRGLRRKAAVDVLTSALATAAAARRGVVLIAAGALDVLQQFVGMDADLVRRGVALVAFCGGVSRTQDGTIVAEEAAPWRGPRGAQQMLVEWCVNNGIAVHATASLSVPAVPLRLARSFAALYTDNPVLSYVADSQLPFIVAQWRTAAGLSQGARAAFWQAYGPQEGAGPQAAVLTARDDVAPYLGGWRRPHAVAAAML